MPRCFQKFHDGDVCFKNSEWKMTNRKLTKKNLHKLSIDWLIRFSGLLTFLDIRIFLDNNGVMKHVLLINP